MEKNQFLAPDIESATIEQLTLQLMATNNELQKVQKERNEMLSNISHDLRAPITAIRSALDLMMSSSELTADDITSTLLIIDRRVKTLENMIQDMYYLFCVEDTCRELDFDTYHAASILEEYFFDATIDTRYENHNLHLDLPHDLDCIIRVDVQKLIRVLDNLFTNAAKYTPPGSSITLSAHQETNTLHITVQDTGNGIPAEALDKIFQRTYTVSNARTPGINTGSGLGLSIARAIIERFGGTIACYSTLGIGTTFHIKLPIETY